MLMFISSGRDVYCLTNCTFDNQTFL